MMEQGWVEESPTDEGCYIITEIGEDFLKRLRYVLEPFHKEIIEEFCKDD